MGITTQVVDEAEGVLLWGEECLIVLWGSGILCINIHSRTDSTVDTYVCRRRTAFAEAAVAVAVAVVGLK